jgi:hypothetical protein
VLAEIGNTISPGLLTGLNALDAVLKGIFKILPTGDIPKPPRMLLGRNDSMRGSRGLAKNSARE